MPRRVLKNKPLVEAILELKWVIPTSKAGEIEVDPHYRILLGRFSERVEQDYPFHEPLPSAQIPDMMAAHMVQHRFRIGQGKWPLIQIGPGIMTVNETEGYIWDDFKRRCEKAVRDLFDAHPAKQSFALRDLALRYIDAVDADFTKESVFDFLDEKMKTKISLPETLFEGGRVNRNPTVFNWQVSFQHDDPGGFLTVRFAVGQRNGNPALIWETIVQASGAQIPPIPDGFSAWLSKAHDLTDDWFFKLIEGDLERRFCGE
ncbi:MAG: TIGR04255 family protein [Nitrospirota bacterium]